MRPFKNPIVVLFALLVVLAAFPILAVASSVPSDNMLYTPLDEPALAATVTKAPTRTKIPTRTKLPTRTPRPTKTPAAPVSQFAPSARTIWDAQPELDQPAGECSGAPINYCAQLVALTPRGTAGMYWKGQELTPYLMARVKPNLYRYTGMNATRDGKVTLTVEFTSATTWKAVQVLTLKKEPNCTHTMTFSGKFLR